MSNAYLLTRFDRHLTTQTKTHVTPVAQLYRAADSLSATVASRITKMAFSDSDDDILAIRLVLVSCRRRQKIRAQAWSLFARLFSTQKLEYSTSKQFLINYTSTSSSLNFGTIVVNYFLIRPEFIQSGFKCVSRFCMDNFISSTNQKRKLNPRAQKLNKTIETTSQFVHSLCSESKPVAKRGRTNETTHSPRPNTASSGF